MSQTTLLLASALALVSGLLYIAVGRAVQDRRLEGHSRIALLAFVAWWYGLATLSLYGMLSDAYAAFYTPKLVVVLTFLYALLLLLCAAFWGLTYYVWYLYTGSPKLLIPSIVFYSALYFVLQYIVVAGRPYAVEVGNWGTEIKYEHSLSGTAGASLLGLLFLLPPVLGALGYFSLFFRTREPLHRYRIGLVAGAILAWFGTSLVASLTGINDWSGWSLVSRMISLVAPLIILAAFRPPAWVRARLASPAPMPA